MCFSATMSFGASALLGSVGAIALKKAETRPMQIFAMTPILFGLQQFSEGVVWLALTHPESEFLAGALPIAVLGFLFFAWVVWPAFVPFFMYLLEKDPLKKKMLKVLLGIGLGVSAILIYVLANYNMWATIESYHIKYDRDITTPYLWIFGIFYLLPTVFSNFISSVKWMWWLGILNLLSYTISKIVFSGFVVSIWCFFGAISSVLVLAIILEAQKKPKIQLSTNQENQLSTS